MEQENVSLNKQLVAYEDLEKLLLHNDAFFEKVKSKRKELRQKNNTSNNATRSSACGAAVIHNMTMSNKGNNAEVK